MKLGIALLAGLIPLLAGPVLAALHTEEVPYRQGDTQLKGHLAYDDRDEGPRPGVLVVHEWWGLNDYAKGRADMLAEEGYVALAVDMYGEGKVTEHPQEAGQWAAEVSRNAELGRQRFLAAYELLRADPHVDGERIAAIGYCFGGTAVLELARSGADLAGVVSFHGGLDTPTPQDAKNIKCKVLALTGGDDPHVPPAQVQAFEDEMRQGGVDWQVVAYGGAVHSFTNPEAGDDPSKGVAYNARADKRSWAAMRQFFDEIFGPTRK
jgi:dienelactone hydrolase